LVVYSLFEIVVKDIAINAITANKIPAFFIFFLFYKFCFN
jgi:hypothetical protein